MRTFFFYFRYVKVVAVIGGGLAGLISSILLNRNGFNVILLEEKQYPFHRVCGEYISNEVIPFLEKNHLYPNDLAPIPIKNFHLTAPSGKSLRMPLDLGGFGISRFVFDKWLFGIAQSEGVKVIHDRVTSVDFTSEKFLISTRQEQEVISDLTIGAFGKRSSLDKTLDRKFINKRYPYVGVKYHVQTDQVDQDVIELHNFNNGYCGISRIEDQKFNLCYLSHRSNLKNVGSIERMEEETLQKNPHLKRIFTNATFLFDKPEVINEISFEVKEPVFNHILMTGDSAGMITPLCGNGMAMAIHSAKILSELMVACDQHGFDRKQLETSYAQEWNKLFARRLWMGRRIQRLFGAPVLSEIAVGLGKTYGPFSRYLMKQTHGAPF